MPESRQYELVYVISPEVGEAGVAEIHAEVEEIVTSHGGSIANTENWGRRRLAYEIDKHRDATYVLELIDGAAGVVAELDRRLKVKDTILRHLVVRVDQEMKKARRARDRRQARQAKRRTAREQAAPAEPPAAADAGDEQAEAADKQAEAPDKPTEAPDKQAGAADEQAEAPDEETEVST